MMNRDECFEILKRHITNEIVVATYSIAVDWHDLNPRDLNYFSHRRDGARAVACARRGARAAGHAASSARTATAAS